MLPNSYITHCDCHEWKRLKVKQALYLSIYLSTLCADLLYVYLASYHGQTVSLLPVPFNFWLHKKILYSTFSYAQVSEALRLVLLAKCEYTTRVCRKRLEILEERSKILKTGDYIIWYIYESGTDISTKSEGV